MIPLWLANPGEDFRIEAIKGSMSLLTANGKELDMKALQGCVLPITAKNAGNIYGVFHGHRIAFRQDWAMRIRGNVIGKTETSPEILTAEPCTHHCAGCSRCK